MDLIADNHRTQAFLYQAIVQRVLRIPFNELKTYIFYTKYPYEKRANLRYAKCTLRDMSEALHLRNRIVCYEHLLANDQPKMPNVVVVIDELAEFFP